MAEKKLKIAWVCTVSNSEIRENLTFSRNVVDFLVRKIFNKPRHLDDYGQWITNAIDEFKNIKNVEIHVVSLHSHINKKVIEFEKDGIFYHFFHSEDDLTVVGKFVSKVIGLYVSSAYDKNCKVINSILRRINPDIVHLYGAEAPQFSPCSLDVDVEHKPLIVSLQTLMSDPKFKENYPISEESYKCRAGIEKKILQHTRYIGSMVKEFKEIVWSDINPEAIFLNMQLFVGEKPHLEKCEKLYDFVYFSLNINKAADLAVEAFIRAFEKDKDITLLVVGDYDENFKRQLDARIASAGATDNVTITGKLPTHDDVINEVKKARVALLPLKIDLVSGTIREAMACGLPVVTTVTAGTPTLNENRKSVLLSETGNHEVLASNMMMALKSEELAKTLIENALITLDEKYGNRGMAMKMVNIYEALAAKYNEGTEIPKEFCSFNPKK